MIIDKKKISEILNCENPALFDVMLNSEYEDSTGLTRGKAEFLKDRNDFIELIYNLFENNEWDHAMKKFPMRTGFILFLYIKDFMDDEEYYEQLGNVINGGIYMHDYFDEIKYLLNARDRKSREYMMAPGERKALKQLRPDIIYRGCGKDNVRGFSWTLDLDQAKFFANRRTGQVQILQGEFRKSDVIAYWEREREIFIDPDNVIDSRVFSAYGNWKAMTNDWQKNSHIMIKNYTVRDARYIRFLEEEVYCQSCNRLSA